MATTTLTAVPIHPGPVDRGAGSCRTGPTTFRAKPPPATTLLSTGGASFYAVEAVLGLAYGRTTMAPMTDGAELGSAVHHCTDAVGMDERLPVSGNRLPPEWALRVPSDYVDVIQHAVPAAIRDARVDPVRRDRVGTDFTACIVVPTSEDVRHPEEAVIPHRTLPFTRSSPP